MKIMNKCRIMEYVVLGIMGVVLMGTGIANGQQRLYFPHIASGDPWNTEICIINTSISQSLTGTLYTYSDDGLSATGSSSVNLPPNGRMEMDINAAYGAIADNIGYMVFETDQQAAVGYTKFYVPGQYRVAVPAIDQVGQGDLHVPHIASDDQWWTGISIVNTTAAKKELTIEFDNGQFQKVVLGAGEHRAFTVRSLFQESAQPAIGSATIKNGVGIIGLELFGSTAASGSNYLSGILIKETTSLVMNYPHIASDATWWTGIVAYNPSSISVTLTIYAYSTFGNLLGSEIRTIDGLSKYIGSVEDLDLPSGTAWLRMTASAPVAGFELFGTRNGNQLAGYTGVGIAGKEGIFAKSNTTTEWTGIAFVNPTENSAKVTLTAFDDIGDQIANVTFDLSPYQKIVRMAQDLFNKRISSATYIIYSATQDIVGFQLNGSLDNMMLDALPGLISPNNDQNGEEPDDMVGMTERHNYWRGLVTEQKLSDLKWSEKLAQYAQQWADTITSDPECTIVHRPDSLYGENIAWTRGISYSPAQIVDLWAEEIDDYDYETNSCSPGKVCGHYTQIVWADTAYVGCGRSTCGDTEVWVCNYDPRGNWVGETPY